VSLATAGGAIAPIPCGPETIRNPYKAKIQFSALLYTHVRKSLGHTFAVAFLSDILPYLRKVVLMIGVLHMGNQFGPFSCKVVSSSEQISCGPHFGRVDIGHGHHTATKKNGSLMGIDFIVFGFPSVDGFHVQGMTWDKGDILF
jgi:hypothetical protein